MSLPDLTSLWLTLRLASIVTLILLVISVPIAWWLANTRSRMKPVLEAVVALPLVLPPTVLGFYLLILFSPNSAVGSFWVEVTGSTLTFSFEGLVLASIIYSLPFAVQPIQSGFEAIGRPAMETARSLGASPLDAFVSVALPLSRRSLLTAVVLSFAHTLGEFGVVLMVGGNIPGETKVIAIDIYESVETLRYDEAHTLSLILLLVSFAVLLFVFVGNRGARFRVSS